MLLKLALVYVCYIGLASSSEFEQDYYWLDYTGGNMSRNALKLHNDSDVYVGQVYIRNYELLTAAVRTNRPYATTLAYKKKLTSNEHVKVLCSHYLQGFKWVPTNVNSYHSIPNIILGGYEVGKKAYFGRVFINGVPFLGKLEEKLFYFANGKRHEDTHSFEVLTYDRPNFRYCSAYCF